YIEHARQICVCVCVCACVCVCVINLVWYMPVCQFALCVYVHGVCVCVCVVRNTYPRACVYDTNTQTKQAAEPLTYFPLSFFSHTRTHTYILPCHVYPLSLS